jgi:hypothetical protein
VNDEELGLQETRRLDAELKKRTRHALTAPRLWQTGFAVSLALKAVEVEGNLAARKRQSKSVAKRRENLAARDRWIREQFANATKNNSRYSIARLRRDLMKSRKFHTKLRPNGKFLTAERLRIIVKER